MNVYKSSSTLTRPANTTAYTAGDVIGADPAANFTLTTLGRAGTAQAIIKMLIVMATNAVPAGLTNLRVHFFDAAPTAIADNAAMNLIAGDRTKYLGYLDTLAAVDEGDTVVALAPSVRLHIAPQGTVYAVVETLGAFTPASAVATTLTVEAVSVGT